MLTKTAEYALRAVVLLGRERDRPLSADYLAAITRVPRRYVHKVLQDLAHAGYVRSQPGRGGGYSLAVAPRQITMLDVVNAVAPVERIRKCPLGIPSHTSLCPLHEELDRAYAATEEAFAEVTVEHLLRSTSQFVPFCDT